ncbi:MAG TPA: hypothetical protein ENJ09_14105 [Planctomycetes bacterium]|nr:hypothetical protein [Planctomycetota bacterium]
MPRSSSKLAVATAVVPEIPTKKPSWSAGAASLARSLPVSTQAAPCCSKTYAAPAFDPASSSNAAPTTVEVPE